MYSPTFGEWINTGKVSDVGGKGSLLSLSKDMRVMPVEGSGFRFELKEEV